MRCAAYNGARVVAIKPADIGYKIEIQIRKLAAIETFY